MCCREQGQPAACWMARTQVWIWSTTTAIRRRWRMRMVTWLITCWPTVLLSLHLSLIRALGLHISIYHSSLYISMRMCQRLMPAAPNALGVSRGGLLRPVPRAAAQAARRFRRSAMIPRGKCCKHDAAGDEVGATRVTRRPACSTRMRAPTRIPSNPHQVCLRSICTWTEQTLVLNFRAQTADPG